MSFREKIDWLSFCTMCLFSIYFFEIARGLITGSHSSGPDYYFKLFWVLVFVQGAIQGVAQVVMAIRSPQDAKTPADERERLIELKAIRPAYALLFVGCLLTIGTMHMGFNVWQFAHCILFVIWIAELLRYGMRLFYYHRAV